MAQTVGERLVKIETDIQYLKDRADEHNEKLDKFIDAADMRYATKEELSNLQEKVSDNRTALTYIITKWGPIIILCGYVVLELVVK